MKKLLLLAWLSFLFIHPCFSIENNKKLQYYLKGEKTRYYTKGNPKAHGLNISIDYPKRWIASEGDRPNVVQKFYLENPKDTDIGCLILIKEIPFIQGQSEEKVLKDLLSNFQQNIPQMSIMGSKETTYDGQKGILFSYTLNQNMAGVAAKSISLTHLFFFKEKMITISCSVTGLESNNNLSNTFKENLPLFYAIGFSIVIHDKWHQNISATKIEKNKSINKDIIKSIAGKAIVDFLTLLIALIITKIISWFKKSKAFFRKYATLFVAFFIIKFSIVTVTLLTPNNGLLRLITIIIIIGLAIWWWRLYKKNSKRSLDI